MTPSQPQIQPGNSPPEQSPPASPTYSPGQQEPATQPPAPLEREFENPGSQPDDRPGQGGEEWRTPPNT